VGTGGSLSQSRHGHRVCVSAAITVTLDGNPPTRRDDTAIPVLNYVFEAVPAGQHSIHISDVMGNPETTSVLVDWTKPIEDISPE
jgi:hypothetical protein